MSRRTAPCPAGGACGHPTHVVGEAPLEACRARAAAHPAPGSARAGAEPPAPPTTDASLDALDGAEVEVTHELERFASALSLLHSSLEDGRVRSGETLTCDGGALAGALLARELGVPATLYVGLY